jgi:excisionase family DNA binding protein
MNATVLTRYREYLDQTGDKAAAASLALADTIQETYEVAAPPAAGQSLTVKDAAAQLRVSTRRVYELCGAGQLAAFKVGRSLRIAAEALDDYRQRGIVRRQPEPFSGRPNRCL